MSSQSSSDRMSCGNWSQDSNTNVPSSTPANIPILEFSSLRLEYRNLPRWKPRVDSDYSSDSDPVTGKRKQRNAESENAVPQKKLKKNEEMEEEESQLHSETIDECEDCDADNEEEESMEESSEKCDGACEHEPEIFRMDDEPTDEISSVTRLIQPSTSGLKRKNCEKLDSPILPKVKRSGWKSE